MSSQWLHKQKNGMKRNSKIFTKKTLSCLVLSAGISLGGIPLLGLSSAYAASNTWDFSYTGSVQSFTAPSTGTYNLEVWGAQGGSEFGNPGGLGGYTEGQINLTAGQTLYVYVGGQGQDVTYNGQFLGGYNGGGSYSPWTNGHLVTGGGGTDIRLQSDGNWKDDLNSRIIVAGGGGGSNDGFNGGYGGGSTGGSGLYTTGGTQSSGGIENNGYPPGHPWADGSFGIGGSMPSSWGTDIGFGGGGWYGGASMDYAGSGGSGYVLTSSSYKPSGYNPSSQYYLSNTQLLAGNQSMPSPSGGTETGQSGNGYARINFVKPDDTTPPVTTDNAPTGWVNKDITVNLTATDNDGGSGVATTYYTLDNGSQQTGTAVNVTGEGVHTLTYWSVDNAENEETHHTATVKIDKTTPVTTDNAPTGWVNKDVTVNLNATDDGGSGVAATYYTIDNGSQQSGTSVNITGEGSHTLTYWSVDNAGNEETHHTATVKIDKTAPVTTDNAPTGWVNKDVTVNLTATDNDGGSGVAATYYTIDNGSQQSGSSVNITAEGVHNIAYWSVDNAGNVEAQHTATVKIDKTAPVTALSTNPGSPNGKNGWYTSNVQVSLNSTDSDGSGVANTEYRINGRAWTQYNGAAFTLSTDGTYTIDYRSTDNVGNTEQFNTETIKLDKTASTLNISLDKTKIWSPNHKMVPVTATINASDVTSGIESVVLASITSNEPLQSDDIQNAKYNTPITGSSDTFELRADRLGNGNGRVYTITYTVTDKAGNVTTNSVTVSVPHDQSSK